MGGISDQSAFKQDAPLLAVDTLSVSFRQEDGVSTPVRDVSLTLHQGETLALVGESGSGNLLHR